MDHNDIAENYVAPMANFLSSVFNMSAIDAYALAWGGLGATNDYKNSTEFNING